jgi:hypothetical protein
MKLMAQPTKTPLYGQALRAEADQPRLTHLTTLENTNLASRNFILIFCWYKRKLYTYIMSTMLYTYIMSTKQNSLNQSNQKYQIQKNIKLD